jgi:hypothetical protein
VREEAEVNRCFFPGLRNDWQLQAAADDFRDAMEGHTIFRDCMIVGPRRLAFHSKSIDLGGVLTVNLPADPTVTEETMPLSSSTTRFLRLSALSWRRKVCRRAATIQPSCVMAIEAHAGPCAETRFVQCDSATGMSE